MIRAAHAFEAAGLGHAILVGRDELVKENMQAAGLDPAESRLEIINARVSRHNPEFVDFLYERLSRQGYLKRDVQRLINQDRNSFAASMVALGYADGMVTGVTRSYDQVLEEVLRVIDPAPDGRVMGMSVALAKGHTLFIADTNEDPVVEAEDMPNIGANSLSVAFGDFRRGYLIVDRQGVNVLRDPYSSKPYVLFYTTKRVGGGVADYDAIKLLKFGTS